MSRRRSASGGPIYEIRVHNSPNCSIHLPGSQPHEKKGWGHAIASLIGGAFKAVVAFLGFWHPPDKG